MAIASSPGNGSWLPGQIGGSAGASRADAESWTDSGGNGASLPVFHEQRPLFSLACKGDTVTFQGVTS